MNGAVGQACGAIAAGDFATEHRADGAVHVANGEVRRDGGLGLEAGLALAMRA